MVFVVRKDNYNRGVWTPTQRGAIAETAIAHAATRLGVVVSKPVAEGARYDLIFDIGSRLIRVQCKSAVHCREVVIVRCRTCRRTAHGFRRGTYSADEVDAFAAYCAELDRCYFLPLSRFGGLTAIQLRLAPTRNNQASRIHWAEDFELAATLGNRPGAIAQLGERLPGRQKVAGSSPAGSIETLW